MTYEELAKEATHMGAMSGILYKLEGDKLFTILSSESLGDFYWGVQPMTQVKMSDLITLTTTPSYNVLKDGERVKPVNQNYLSLRDVLDRAYEQASTGKERHAKGLPFEKQRMQIICDDLGGPQFAIGQAHKKSAEALGLDRDAAVRELLGAINYLAGAVIYLEKNND